MYDQLEKVNSYTVHTCTHDTSLICSLLGPTRQRRRPRGDLPGGVPHPTCTHSTAIRAPTTRTNKHAHERTAPARLPYTRRLLSSCSGRLTPTCRPLDGRHAASTAAHRPLAASPLRCCHRCWRRRRCRRGRRCCKAIPLRAYHCRCRQQGTCESRTGDSNRALGVGPQGGRRRRACHRDARGGLRAR